ncbi:ATP-binding cassette domain-containing protein [Actinacidiphila bryophytorum]|uniref:ABC-type xenobiotic transporter n=1 Tax=Actinacidiphila bryophytorum TaxID=1436133 RepID=A0A9W4H2X3_9ACTN|nr:ATP-binding cassette domain-containing protein [Actinacidiphila bryophytorum]MBM9437064.1 ATP-binding cassette domain-containing protein [Actinacidiphila bryophytorum]MBN6546379.1 ATP-binding cassette domain-containing protein [Actinacidiphila bryophytorum]CAG7646468.1 Daunorubicin/doxorubicin resistance ATP-binding protein DrrA [Actinacidiphila bryophytorum]
MTSSATDLAVQARGLVKTFGRQRAVDGLDIDIPAGIVHGVLGPNGAGKTTLIRMLATLLRPDAGTARVFGHDVVREAEAVRRRISLTGQFASVDEDLTARENLVLLARLHGHTSGAARRRADELLEGFGLTEAAGRLTRQLSGGMRRRLDIAASILVRPDLLFLDEPTTGLDPRSRSHVWDLVRRIVAEGTTVLLTTQYLDEADQLAHRIAVVDHGRVIASGTRGELKASAGAGGVRVRLSDPGQRDKARAVLTTVLGAPVHPDDDPAGLRGQIAADRPGGSAGIAVEALAHLARAGIEVSDFSYGRPSLDEVFLALTGNPAELTEATA